MPEGVYITGIGAVSAIGEDVAGNLRSLEGETSAIGPIRFLETVHRDEVPVAEVALSNEGLMELLKLSDPSRYSRTTLLGGIAAGEAIEQAELSDQDPARSGLISATTTGGMRMTEKYYKDYLENQSKNEYILRHDCGDSTEKLGDHLGIRGFLTTINTACSSSANSIMLGARMIRSGALDRVVAGGTDALTKFTLNGFNTLFILDQEPCKPFDNERKGLNLGEGSGFVVLERESILEKEGKEPLAELVGYGNSNDAYHQTASSPEGNGAYGAMQKALGIAGLESSAIDHVNAHGTGTPNNDLSEGKALKKLFGERIPPFSSSKSYTGHTLGASGGIEAVFSVLALKEGTIFPNLRFSNPMEELELYPQTGLTQGRELNYVLSNSFGFGGNNTSLIFGRA